MSSGLAQKDASPSRSLRDKSTAIRERRHPRDLAKSLSEVTLIEEADRHSNIGDRAIGFHE